MTDLSYDQAIGDLRQANVARRRRAVITLGALGDTRAVPDLSSLLADPHWQVRYHAAETLGKLTDGRAFDGLIGAMDDGVDWVRFMALQSLARLAWAKGSGGTLSGKLIKLTASANPALAESANQVLDRLAVTEGSHPFQQPEAMLGLLVDADPKWRLLAIDKLQSIADPRVEPALLGALGDGEARVRGAAAMALAGLGTQAAASSLVQFFFVEKDHSSKQAAASALEAIGRRLGCHPFLQAEAMVAAAGHDNPAVRRFALEKLAGIKELAAYRALVEALGADGDGGDLRELAIAGLVAHGEAAALLKLHPLLEQERKRDKKSPITQKLAQAVDALKGPAKASLLLPAKGVYCRDCLRRFDTWIIKTGFLSKIGFAGCFTCGLTSNRMEGIKTVVAIMAEPWPEPTRLEGDTLYINMPMRDRKNYMVDFDRLEVHEAPSVNLDDEIQLLLRRSAEDYSMNPEKMKTIPVQLVGKPKINMNSINLLRFKMVAEFKGPVKGADGRLVMEE